MDNNPASSRNSTYSKLTKGDYCANLIKNSFQIHKPSIKIGNRIHFFKTIISPNLKTEKLLPDIKIKKGEDVKKESFDKEEYFNALNQQNYETQKKITEKKKDEKERT